MLERWDLQPEYIRVTKRACGVTNAYDVAADLGVDRWAALVGAHQGSSGPVCIVDCGTAITIDALSPAGEHLGGLIMPGITMLAELLVRTYYEAQDKSVYQVRERINFEKT